MIEITTEILWIIASVMIFSSGIYFSFKLKFIHLRFGKMFKALKNEDKKSDSISAFQSLMIALAGRIGVGSLAGIALGVYIGGPGVLFWIWLTSLLCASNEFVESTLSTIFRRKDSGNIYKGGPFYYISEGLKKKRLALTYAILLLIAYIGGFLTMQINTITKSINTIVPVNPLIIGIIIAILVGMTIIGGVKRIANTTGKLIPVVACFYIILCSYIIITNLNLIPNVLADVLNSALNFKTFGTGVLTTLLIGMQKGIFSSEVGLGTGSIAAASTATEKPENNGLVQTLGIHIENLLIATITVFVICISNYRTLVINDPNGIEITLFAFAEHFGSIGILFIIITISLFGLSTILTGYYYGEVSLKYIIKNTSKLDIILLKFATIILLVIGSVISSNLLWRVVDIMVGLIAIINIYSIFKLRKIFSPKKE